MHKEEQYEDLTPQEKKQKEYEAIKKESEDQLREAIRNDRYKDLPPQKRERLEDLREELIRGGQYYQNRRIDPVFYEKVTAQIAKDNGDAVRTIALKLLYHPVTILCSIVCLAAAGGPLSGGTPLLAALLISYVSCYASIFLVVLLEGALSGKFRTAPPEQYMELIWLMSLGCRLWHDEVDLRMKTAEMKYKLRYEIREEEESGVPPQGYSVLEIECLLLGFIPVTITDRCGMGIASTYKRHYNEIWRWQA